MLCNTVTYRIGVRALSAGDWPVATFDNALIWRNSELLRYVIYIVRL